jgi:polyphosphate kinase
MLNDSILFSVPYMLNGTKPCFIKGRSVMADTIKDKFINRELSWLEFNGRVLEQACDPKVPLLERARFLAITCSNLDEFFMVRVGGLLELAKRKSVADASGLTPSRQLDRISAMVREMVSVQYRCLILDMLPLLERQGILMVKPETLAGDQMSFADRIFESDIKSVLTPVGISLDYPMPLLANRSLHLLVRIRTEANKNSGHFRFAVIRIPKNMARICSIPADSGFQFVLADHLIKQRISSFFPSEQVEECLIFRITRNADMGVREDSAGYLLEQMESILDERTRSGCVRLEIEKGASEPSVGFLRKILDVSSDGIFESDGPVDLSFLSNLASIGSFAELKYKQWPPLTNTNFYNNGSIFDIIRRGDNLLYHPYESFDPVVRLVEEAAADPDVTTIKQVLYRTSRNSPIISALARAAQSGKYVTALVELKARFDEERNIEWAKELETSGVQVIYGLKNLKTHCKICIVFRKESSGLVRYVHYGTGNYNEITARLYSDISFFTCEPDYVTDASAFFNTITGSSLPGRYKLIEAAPLGLRKKIISLIQAETERSSAGKKAFIQAKMNSLADTGIIKALYAASKAGVKIELNIRGICCLRPGVPGLSENIRVVSIIDRFLEHARVFRFHNGGDDLLFIASADWMPRNLDKRVELMVNIADPACRQKLKTILENHFSDNVNAWDLSADGKYKRLASTAKKKPFRSQEELYLQVCAETERNRSRRIAFEPVRPPTQK